MVLESKTLGNQSNAFSFSKAALYFCAIHSKCSACFKHVQFSNLSFLQQQLMFMSPYGGKAHCLLANCHLPIRKKGLLFTVGGDYSTTNINLLKGNLIPWT